MLEDQKSTKYTERNNIQVALVKSALADFENKIKSMPKNETEYRQPNEKVDIVKKIVEFNK